MKIRGVLRNGREAEMTIDLKESKGGVVWEQRALTHTAAHLNRDYVCYESKDFIVTHWLPCDWRTFTVEDEQPIQKTSEWGTDEEEDD